MNSESQIVFIDCTSFVLVVVADELISKRCDGLAHSAKTKEVSVLKTGENVAIPLELKIHLNVLIRVKVMCSLLGMELDIDLKQLRE